MWLTPVTSLSKRSFPKNWVGFVVFFGLFNQLKSLKNKTGFLEEENILLADYSVQPYKYHTSQASQLCNLIS